MLAKLQKKADRKFDDDQWKAVNWLQDKNIDVIERTKDRRSLIEGRGERRSSGRPLSLYRYVLQRSLQLDERQIVTISLDETVRMWDNLRIGELIARAKKRVSRQELTAADKETFFISDQ